MRGLDARLGWPPDPPEGPELSTMRETLWALLEDGNVPQYLIELVDQVVDSLERDADRECPTCQALALEAEAKAAREGWL
jgi:hypothetical protein